MTKKQEPIDEFDYGFSFSDGNEIVKDNDDKQTIKQLQERLNRLHKAIIPFLDNLCKNPEKSDIHWPDRVPKIESYKKKLQDIVEGRA